MAEFFSQNLPLVFFVYGLSFFLMGFAVLLEIGHSSESEYAKALRPLAGFGILHGSHEWFEMAVMLHRQMTGEPEGGWEAYLRLALLMVSFLMLVVFGERLIIGPNRPRLRIGLSFFIVCLWAIGLLLIFSTMPPEKEHLIAADVYTRYSLAIPGAGLTVWGLVLQRRRFKLAGMEHFGRDVLLAAVAFGLYGCIGQLFASPSTVFPSTYLNSTVFLSLFGFPIQLFRAFTAGVAAVFIVRSLRSFDEDNRRRIEALREAGFAERRRLEELRGEMLHSTIQAQEAERRRIARELHDETGQTLTALGLGLRGLSATILVDELRAVQQGQKLELLAKDGISQLQHVITGLRPPQLDELGLPAALRWYAGEVKTASNVQVGIQCQGPSAKLSADERATLFRIAQEAVNNVVRHSEASQASITLNCSEDTILMVIEDNGCGFDVDIVLKGQKRQCWGLLGMKERAALIGGTCEITSRRGKGTRVAVRAPLTQGGENDDHQAASG